MLRVLNKKRVICANYTKTRRFTQPEASKGDGGGGTPVDNPDNFFPRKLITSPVYNRGRLMNFQCLFVMEKSTLEEAIKK